MSVSWIVWQHLYDLTSSLVRGGFQAVMGGKARIFSPITAVPLEDLVPQDHFNHHLEQTLALAFVRDPAQKFYAAGGRSSIDRVVLFKLQLVMFFEGLRSERQLMEVAADRLSLRWFLRYDLHERLPDDSSLSKIRDRGCPTPSRLRPKEAAAPSVSRATGPHSVSSNSPACARCSSRSCAPPAAHPQLCPAGHPSTDSLSVR